MAIFHLRWGLGSRRKATIDLSLLSLIPVSTQHPNQPSLHHSQLVAMALACSWSELSLGLLGCGLYIARALDHRRCPTLAPRAYLPRLRQETKGLQHCHAAAQAIITVIYWLSQHLVALPPTSRRCYRPTANTRMMMSLLLVSFFLCGSRATLVTTNSDAHVG